MESDLSLIEITREDDSLLSIPNDDVSSSSSSTSFLSSPLLHFSKPPFGKTKGGMDDTCGPNASSGMEKENVNVNKPETSGLRVEPLQMKRKKKGGGGYNLRKSLAWDRAFCTEEGVLDPLELSLLSGNLGNSSGLSVIQEGRESLCNGLDTTNEMPGLQAVEDKLFKQPPLKESRKISSPLPPKPGLFTTARAGSASAAKRKVFSSQDVNKSASKRGGGPRPVVSSALGKPSSGNMVKVSNKFGGTKVSSVLTPKSDPPVVSAASKSKISIASHSKRNQIAKPAIVQTNIAATSSSTSIKSVLGGMKSSSPSNSCRKPATQPARRNVGTSKTLIPSSKTVQRQLSSHTAKSEIKTLDPVPSPNVYSLNTTGGEAARAATFNLKNAGSGQHTQPQAAKASGLRMPSPSLGFFGQSKPSPSHSLPQRAQLRNRPQSSASSLTTPGALNLLQPRPPQPSTKMVAQPSLPRKVGSDLELNTKRNLESQLPSNSKTTNQPLPDVADDLELKNCVHGVQSVGRNVLMVEGVCSQNKCNEMLLQTGRQGQLKLDTDNDSASVTDLHQKIIDVAEDHPHLASHGSVKQEAEFLYETNRMTVSQRIEDISCDLSTKNLRPPSESEFSSVAGKVHEDPLHGMDEMNKQPGQQFKMMPEILEASEEIRMINCLNAAGDHGTVELETCETDYSCGEVQLSDATQNSIDDDTSIHNREMHTSAEVIPQLLSDYPIETPAEKPEFLSVHSIMEQNSLSDRRPSSDANLLYLDGAASIDSSKDDLGTSAVDISPIEINEPSEKASQNPEVPNLSSSVVQNSRYECASCPAVDLVSEKCLSVETSLDKEVIKYDESLLGSSETYNGGVTNRNITCPMASIEPNCDFAMPENVQQIQLENAVADSVQSEVIFEATQQMIEFQGDGSHMEIESKAHATHAGATCHIDKTDHCFDGQHKEECDLENACLTAHSTSPVQPEVASEVNYIVKHGGALDEQVKSPYARSDSHPVADSCHEKSGISMVLTGFSKENVVEWDVERCQNVQIFSDVADIAQMCDEQPFEESERTIMADVADASATDESLLLIPHNQSQFEITEQEDAGVVNLVKEENPTKVYAGSELIFEASRHHECNGQVIDTFTTCKIDVLDACLDGGHIVGNDGDNACLLPERPSVVQADVPSLENDMINLGRAVDEQDKTPLSVQYSRKGSSCNESDASMALTDCSIPIKNTDEKCVEQSKQVPIWSDEIELQNQSEEELDGQVFVENRHSEDSAQTIRANATDISATDESGQIIPYDMGQNVFIEQEDKLGGAEKVVMEVTEDDQFHSDCTFEENNCQSIIIVDRKPSLVEDGFTKNFGEGNQLPNVDLVYEQPSKNHLVVSNSDFPLMTISSVETREPYPSADIVAKIPVPPGMQNVVLDMEENTKNRCVDEEAPHVVEVESSVENVTCSLNSMVENGNEGNHQVTSVELDSSLYKTGEPIQVAANSSTSIRCCSSEELNLLVRSKATSSGSSWQGAEINSSSSFLSDEAYIIMLQDNCSPNGEFDHEFDNAMCKTEDKDTTLASKKPDSCEKKDVVMIKPPPNAVPFSDEWLAAFEAAGEEILTMKRGAVQNSPPDKPQIEPSPWSPVKRNNNQGIGPFDCTKYTNNVPPSIGD